MEFKLEAAPNHRPGTIPVLPQPGATVRNIAGDERSTLQAYLAELDIYYDAVKKFTDQEPDEVLQQIAGFAARLCEMRALLQRSGSTLASKLRTREIEPLLDQMEFQFKIASRLLSVREFDFKTSGGGV